MGKTGTTTWAQVKSVSGKIRLVPARFADTKRPGPNQRFKAHSKIKKVAPQESRFRGKRGRGRRGGDTSDGRVRKRIRRSKASAMGVKTR